MRRHLVQKSIFWLWLTTLATPTLAMDLTPPRHEAGVLGISAGAEYTSGKYGGTATTDISYFPLTTYYGTERWLGWLTVPYLSVEGPGDVVIIGGGMGGRKVATTTTTRRTESGIGDIIAALSYRWLKQTETHPALDLTGKVYFATADETQGLGTGENDYAVQLGLIKSIRAWTGTGTVGYLLTGDPATVTYNDVFYGKLDVARNFERHSLGVMFEAQQATIAGGDAPAKLTGYLALRPSTHMILTGYLLQGYSDAAPDWGAGILLTLQY